MCVVCGVCVCWSMILLPSNSPPGASVLLGSDGNVKLADFVTAEQLQVSIIMQCL